ncbi:MAG: HK97 gp10 family phage protein [Bacillota bacterium]
MADGIHIEWEGFEEVKRALEEWKEEAITAIVEAMDQNGEDLLQKAQALAPKLTGDLEGSGTKSEVKVDPVNKIISVQVGFHKPYAARRHEESYRPGLITMGKPGADGMKSGRKYLERPLKRYARKYIENVAEAVRSTTEGK